MSFVRLGRQQHPKGKKNLRTKKTAPPKKEWVSTVNDLSVHKLTPTELSCRHEKMQSHNKAAAQWELREKALKRRFRKTGSPSSLDQTSLSFIREGLSDQMQLQDVLARSDKAMSVVKDIFGDAPRRQIGHPSVTVAPNGDSMMDQQALNELEYSDEDHGKVVRTQTTNIPVTPRAASRTPDQAALNATVAVQRVRHTQNKAIESNEENMISYVLNPRHPSVQSGNVNISVRKTKKCADRSSELDGSSIASLSGDQSSLGLLQSMLGQVEADVDFLCSNTIPSSDQSRQPHRTKGLTGFSVALVSTLGRLVHLFKQNQEESQKAALERRHFEEELKEQRGLINKLTAENRSLREEIAALRLNVQRQISELEEKVDTMVLVMSEFVPPLIPAQDHDNSLAAVNERDRVQIQGSPAVLLSPSRQRDNWSHIPVAHPVPAKILHSPENHISHGSNLISLPSMSSASLSSLSSKLSSEDMLAEIAQLNRQNELIKAQLSQAKSQASGGRGSFNSGIEEGRLSCVSKGSPQSAVESRMSGSSSTKSFQQAENEQRAETSVLNVEQRLLELNRQSAAARNRLLELIEKQKNTCARLSPSASPFPRSAFSPVTGLESRASSEVSVLQQEPLLQTNNEKWGACYEPSPQSLGSKANDNKAKETQRTSGDWFSLSTHLRQ